MRVHLLRHVVQRAPQLLPQVLDVPPLGLVDGLAGQVDVVDGQLGFVEKPLHHEHRACGVDTTSPPGQTLKATPSSLYPRSSGCAVTHFLAWGRVYIRRSSSTLLPREPVCSFLAPVLPSTCTNSTNLSSIPPALPACICNHLLFECNLRVK